MQNLQIADLNYLVFLIPGFLMVWCFKKFTAKPAPDDFEFAGLSFFWGLVNLMLWELLVKKEIVDQTLKNIYATTFILCIFAVVFAYGASWIALQDWWMGLKKIFKPRKLK